MGCEGSIWACVEELGANDCIYSIRVGVCLGLVGCFKGYMSRYLFSIYIYMYTTQVKGVGLNLTKV